MQGVVVGLTRLSVVFMQLSLFIFLPSQATAFSVVKTSTSRKVHELNQRAGQQAPDPQPQTLLQNRKIKKQHFLPVAPVPKHVENGLLHHDAVPQPAAEHSPVEFLEEDGNQAGRVPADGRQALVEIADKYADTGSKNPDAAKSAAQKTAVGVRISNRGTGASGPPLDVRDTSETGGGRAPVVLHAKHRETEAGSAASNLLVQEQEHEQVEERHDHQAEGQARQEQQEESPGNTENEAGNHTNLNSTDFAYDLMQEKGFRSLAASITLMAVALLVLPAAWAAYRVALANLRKREQEERDRLKGEKRLAAPARGPHVGEHDKKQAQPEGEAGGSSLGDSPRTVSFGEAEDRTEVGEGALSRAAGSDAGRGAARPSATDETQPAPGDTIANPAARESGAEAAASSGQLASALRFSGAEELESAVKHPKENSGKTRNVFLLLLWINTLVSVDGGVLSSVLEVFEDGYQASDVAVGILGAVSYAAIAVAAPPMGHVLGKVSQKAVLVAALVANGLATMAFATSPSVVCMIVARFIIGSTQAVFVVYLPVWAPEFAPATSATLWVGLLQVCVPLGSILAFLGAGLPPNIYWRYPLGITSGLLLATAIGLAFVDYQFLDSPWNSPFMKKWRIAYKKQAARKACDVGNLGGKGAGGGGAETGGTPAGGVRDTANGAEKARARKEFEEEGMEAALASLVRQGSGGASQRGSFLVVNLPASWQEMQKDSRLLSTSTRTTTQLQKLNRQSAGRPSSQLVGTPSQKASSVNRASSVTSPVLSAGEQVAPNRNPNPNDALSQSETMLPSLRAEGSAVEVEAARGVSVSPGSSDSDGEEEEEVVEKVTWCEICGNPVFSLSVAIMCTQYLIVSALLMWSARLFLMEFYPHGDKHDPVRNPGGWTVADWKTVVVGVFSGIALTSIPGGAVTGGCLVDAMGGYVGLAHRIAFLKLTAGLLFVMGALGTVCCLLPHGRAAWQFYVLGALLWVALFLGGLVTPGVQGMSISVIPHRGRPSASALSQMVYQSFGWSLGCLYPSIVMACIGGDDVSVRNMGALRAIFIVIWLSLLLAVILLFHQKTLFRARVAQLKERFQMVALRREMDGKEGGVAGGGGGASVEEIAAKLFAEKLVLEYSIAEVRKWELKTLPEGLAELIGGAETQLKEIDAELDEVLSRSTAGGGKKIRGGAKREEGEAVDEAGEMEVERGGVSERAARTVVVGTVIGVETRHESQDAPSAELALGRDAQEEMLAETSLSLSGDVTTVELFVSDTETESGSAGSGDEKHAAARRSSARASASARANASTNSGRYSNVSGSPRPKTSTRKRPRKEKIAVLHAQAVPNAHIPEDNEEALRRQMKRDLKHALNAMGEAKGQPGLSAKPGNIEALVSEALGFGQDGDLAKAMKKPDEKRRPQSKSS